MLKEYKIIKEKHWLERWIRIYQTETGAFLVLEESENEDIISASFHFFWKEALKDFNRRKRDDSYRKSKKDI